MQIEAQSREHAGIARRASHRRRGPAQMQAIRSGALPAEGLERRAKTVK
jgi:hypothetical protein